MNLQAPMDSLWPMLLALLRIIAMLGLGLLLVVYPTLYLMQDRLLFLGATIEPRTLDWARSRPEVDAGGIVAWGRSLGAGVAVHLAAQRAVAGVVLLSPYDSLAAVAQGHCPFVPVRWLLRQPFDAVSLAPAVKAPLLAFAMAGDRLIPALHSRRLVQAWGGPRQLLVFDDGDHNRVPEPAYFDAIGAFLRQLAPAP